MVDRLRQYVSFLALTFWLGGLTFYSLIVVPTGAEVVGRTEQGFVTSAVTLKLNWIGTTAFVVLLWDLMVVPSRVRCGTWLMLVILQFALILLHPRLDQMLDFASHEVVDQAKFYGVHRIYLWLVAGQWLAGMFYAWLAVMRKREG
jgi:hypothetical protein